MQNSESRFVAMHEGDISVVLDIGTPVPSLLHWGRFIGDDLSGFAEVIDRPVPHGGLDVVAPMTLLPEAGAGYGARPGIEGFRSDGRDWAPRFVSSSISDAGSNVLIVDSVDPVANVTVTSEFRLEPSGVLRTKTTLTNTGHDSYTVLALRPTLALPSDARETLTFSGRWTNEFQPVRQMLATGSLGVENRSGRTSHNRVPMAFAGTPGFCESNGDVWGVHLEWSGNSAVQFDATTDGRRCVQVEELLLPGEIVLGEGESYSTPWVCGSFSADGLTRASQRFHRYLRDRVGHPISPRPVTLNIWEAVYFDHDLATLRALADAAADIGVERYVVDDGWFHRRRHDRAGLGDWWVDRDIWPDGLGPIADHVVSRGMEFGLWVEPEMVNPDSDLYRAHSDWVLHDERYEPIFGRNQLVLNLSREDVRAYLFEKVDALLRAYPISYLKWDMNRDLVHPSSRGQATVHSQTLGVYELLDSLRSAHPGLEIESCASGGGRIDFGILGRTDRVWTSDCNDALDRQRIQRGYSMVFPPELMGAHIGGPQSHTTRRSHSLAFRAGTALFGHFGIEWNILETTSAERDALREIVSTYKRFRSLLHTGSVVRLDHSNNAVLAHGVVAEDQTEALFAYVVIGTPESLTVEPLRLKGLAPESRYRVEVVPLVSPPIGPVRRQTAWLETGFEASGRFLSAVGVQPPTLDPESLVLIRVAVVEERTS